MEEDTKGVKSIILQAIRDHLDSLELDGQAGIESDLYTKNTPVALEQAAERLKSRSAGLDTDLYSKNTPRALSEIPDDDVTAPSSKKK